MSPVVTVGHPIAAIARGRLKHSWLENEVLNKTERDVLWLRRHGEWPELARFLADAAEAVALAEEVTDGFSPSQLVDRCSPLLSLPRAEREAVQDAVHRAYLQVFDAPGAASKLRQAGARMSQGVSDLLREWCKADDAYSEAVLQAQWREVLDAATELCGALDGLPRGVVLP